MQTATIKAQRPRMRVIKLRSDRKPATGMCNLSFASVEKPASRKKRSKRNSIEKLLPATAKVASPKVVRTLSNIDSHLSASLLSDVKSIFKLKKVAQLRTQSILNALCADKKKPWATFHNGKEIGARQLASLLKPYGIHSRDLRFSGFAFKGYKLEWFLV